ncbi:hypothetical protein L6164_015509 [Bauhinia variegata]|uniref:Uncharacterized protein n=1 Tax=Bauhinia variegata TaxID=167791 RepID=A0ACB9NMR9_BAUVA|nr:hypothetical protein L6164_015509 [Bauhinia variegata]
MDEDDCVSSLLCHENETFLGDEDSFIHLRDCSSPEDEYVNILIEREIDLGFKKDESLVFGNWIKRARLDAINWILKKRATFGFRFQTAHLSVTYLDRFLSRRSIDKDKYWAIRFLSVACLSIAAKMEECNVPPLSEFQLDDDYSFESKVIQRMELLVLSTLEWKMSFTTPFVFLPYFITKFCNESPAAPTHILSRTVQVISTIIKEVNLMDHRPSVIAAAATLMALDPKLTRKALELKMSSVSQYKFLQTEEILASYNLMQRLYVDKTRGDKLEHSKNPSPSHTQSRAIDLLESSSVTSAATTKRGRLAFNDHKESHGTPEGQGL